MHYVNVRFSYDVIQITLSFKKTINNYVHVYHNEIKTIFMFVFQCILPPVIHFHQVLKLNQIFMKMKMC